MDSRSGRPSTGRPTTGRPTTGRPGTRAGTSSGRPVTRGATATQQQQQQQQQQQSQQQYYIEEEWDDEYYESEDDGDVFAFVPPDLGPAPELHSNPLDPSIDAQNAHTTPANSSHPLHPSYAQQPPSGPEPQQPADDDTYYFDEATGAVYDAQGRLVDMPPGIDLTSLVPDAQPAAITIDTHAPASQAATYHDQGQLRSLPPHLPRSSIDNRSYDSTSTLSKDMSGAALTHAKSYGAFPSMDTLPEVDSLPNSRGNPELLPAMPNARDLGTTANGAISFDETRPRHVVLPGSGGAAGQNQRGIIGLPTFDSNHTDLRHSPDSDIKYPLDNGDYTFNDDDMDKMHNIVIGEERLGTGDGMAHPHVDGVHVGQHGMRMVELEMEMEEDSPYPEVRASVSNIDDPDMPVATARTWFISLVLTIISSGCNMFFSLRYPAPSISPTIVLLISYPLGKILAAILPIRTFTAPRWLGGFEWSLNPGVYNIKEHTLTTIMAGIAISPAYAFNVIIVQDSPLFYNQPRSVGFAALFVLSSQTFGFGLAGMCRRFLVWPASMIWPQNLVAATILNTLHAEEESIDGSMTRFRFFGFVSIAACVWYFVPAYLFNALSVFNWVCWIWPQNVPVNVLFGSVSGLGMSVLTFDWAQISWIGSPLVTPWWAECNIFAGFAIVFWLVAPILYFTNTWFQAYLPFNSSGSWDRFGQPYQISRVILNGLDLDKEAYEAYSPLYLSTTLTLVYFTGFATVTAVLVHTALWHGKALWKGVQRVRTEEDDIHAKFMRHYKEAPDWWYGVILLISFVFAITAVEVYDTGMPVWALVISLLIPVIYILPSGFIYAMTGQAVGTNLIAELIVGYMLPGKPFPNMIFKVYAVQGMLGGLQFVQDLKLGHYMKIPPRVTFTAQVIGTIVSVFVQVGVKEWMFANIPNICDPNEPHNLTCPHHGLFYTASLIWGAIGPARMFGHGSPYWPIFYSLLFGALVPIPFWLLARRFPRSMFRYISWPVLLTGTSYMPPATGLNISAWFATGFVFQYLIRKYNFRWWSKFNFVLAAAMDSGTIVSALIIFFALQLPKKEGLSLRWWGNEIFMRTFDGSGMPYLTPPADGFGPLPTY